MNDFSKNCKPFPFCCPNCGAECVESGKVLTCKNGHCFDRAKSGYYNLLLPTKGNKKFHGDNPLMVKARRDFLEKGFYAPLLKALQSAVKKYSIEGGICLDCGCGEGYYTAGVLDAIGEEMQVCGIDISKDAVALAAKKCKGAEFAVASAFHLPAPENSVSMLLQIFSPHAEEEFGRVLKKDGIFIEIFPGKRHLYDLKAAVYDDPYENEPTPFALPGFELLESIHVENRIALTSNTDIENLFMMTPYYYKTGKVEQERLHALTALETETEFHLLVFRKGT